LQQSGNVGVEQAWLMFGRMSELNEVDTTHLNIMLKACVSLKEQRAAVKRTLDHTDVELDHQTYAIMITQVDQWESFNTSVVLFRLR
jgi:uncharacterized protein YlxP (DUF503 family)